MSREFTRELLFQVRNGIAVTELIKELKIPHHKEGENLIFNCPVCGQANTGVLVRKNLCRCFDCQRNFNTIDLVLLVTERKFKESIQYLIDYKLELQSLKRTGTEEKLEEVDSAKILAMITKAREEIRRNGV